MARELKDIGEGIGLGSNTGLGGATSRTDERRLRVTEDRMLDELNKLVFDEETGLPMLPNLREEVKTSKLAKDESIGGVETKVGDITGELFKQMYKQGVTQHGKMARLFKDTSKEFKQKVGLAEKKYDLDMGKIEDESIVELDKIRESIYDTKSRYETTGGEGSVYRTLFPEMEYDVAGRTGVKPMEDVEEQMYEFDYLTGRKKDSVV